MIQNSFLILLFIFLFGAAIGSFLNVVIYRIPKRLEFEDTIAAKEILNIDTDEDYSNYDSISLLQPSRCPKCDNKLKYRHNIPIFGWLLLRGKCYFCKSSISIEYPIVELLTALIYVLIYVGYGLSLQSLYFIILVTTLISLFFIDLKHQILPDNLTLPLVWIGIIINYYGGFVTLEQSVWGAIIGYLSLWSVFWLYKIVTGKEGFGYGDFKLLAAIGAWFGYSMILYVIFVSCLIGILITIFINIFHKKTNVIAFGPAIILATCFYLFTQDNLYLWYNHMIFMQI